MMLKKSNYLVLLSVLLMTCVDDPSEDMVFLSINNQTGFDYSAIRLNFFSGNFSKSYLMGTLNRGQNTGYFEIPKDSLSVDGFYYANVTVRNRNISGMIYQIGSISPKFHPSRAEPLIAGNYTYCLCTSEKYYLRNNIEFETEADSDSTLIKIKNNSTENFSDVRIYYFKEGKILEVFRFGEVVSGQSSDFYSPKFAYMNPIITAYTSDDSLTYIPNNFFKKDTLNSGKYLFELDIIYGSIDNSRIAKD